MNGISITPPILGKMFDDGYFTPKDCKAGNHKDVDYNDDGVLICLWCGEEQFDKKQSLELDRATVAAESNYKENINGDIAMLS